MHHLLVVQGPLAVGLITVIDGYSATALMCFLGWLVYLVYYIIYTAATDSNAKGKSELKQLMLAGLFWAPLIVLVFLDGVSGLKNYTLATGTAECLAMMFAFVLMILFGKGVDGKRAYESKMMGTGMAVFVILILCAVMYPFGSVAYEYTQKVEGTSLYFFFGVIVYQTVLSISQFKMIRNASMAGSFKEKDVGSLIIVGMIFSWMILLNVLRLTL